MGPDGPVFFILSQSSVQFRRIEIFIIVHGIFGNGMREMRGDDVYEHTGPIVSSCPYVALYGNYALAGNYFRI